MAQTRFIDYYRILKISKSADTEQIRSAYIRLAKQQHPDMGGTVRAMRRLNQAYETLRDPRRRTAYDLLYRQRSSGVDAIQDADTDELDIFFNELYQSEPRKRGRNPFVMAMSVAGLALVVFVVLAVGRMLTSSSPAVTQVHAEALTSGADK